MTMFCNKIRRPELDEGQLAIERNFMDKRHIGNNFQCVLWRKTVLGSGLLTVNVVRQAGEKPIKRKWISTAQLVRNTEGDQVRLFR